MTRTEAIVYSLIGFSRKGTTTFACATDIMAKLMFEQGIPREEIRLSRDVYPKVAEIRN